MAVHNKCNITKAVLEKLSSLTWGVDCQDTSCSILENYIEYLDCDNVKRTICVDPDNCQNPIVYFHCKFNISSISIEIPTNNLEYDILFKLNTTNYVGGTAPFQYDWTYNHSDFTAVGDVVNGILKLKLKEDRTLDLLVVNISVTVTDANDCSDSKSCVLDSGDIQCNQFYQACYNPRGLVVENNYVSCVSPRSLVVVHI